MKIMYNNRTGCAYVCHKKKSPTLTTGSQTKLIKQQIFSEYTCPSLTQILPISYLISSSNIYTLSPCSNYNASLPDVITIQFNKDSDIKFLNKLYANYLEEFKKKFQKNIVYEFKINGTYRPTYLSQDFKITNNDTILRPTIGITSNYSCTWELFT